MEGRLKVLIVDDNADVRRLYAIGLNQRGFEVKLAANGAEAVERATSERPDVIVLDWVMPVMDGGEALSRLHAVTNGDTAVIVISGQPQPTQIQGDPRIRSWLTKPVTVEQLVQEVRGRALTRPLR